MDFQKTDGVPPGDSLGGDLKFRDWGNLGYRHMNGVYGGDVAYCFEMPDDIAKLSASGIWNNHANSFSLDYRILYSLDGKDFKALVEKQYAGGDFPEITGSIQLPPKTQKLWLTYQIPGNSYGVVLKSVDVQLALKQEGNKGH